LITTLVKLGDADIVPQLLQVYIYETNYIQDALLTLFKLSYHDNIHLNDPEQRLVKVLKLNPVNDHIIRFQEPNLELRSIIESRVTKMKKERQESVSEGGLKIELEVIPNIVRVGDSVTCKCWLTNTTDKSIFFIRNSNKVDIGFIPQIWTPNGHTSNESIIMPIDHDWMKLLDKKELVELKPGDKYELIKGQGYFGRYRLDSFVPSMPGVYQFKLTYNINISTGKKTSKDKLGTEDVTQVRLVSNLSELEVHAQDAPLNEATH
jgi:hypothetical protein